MVLIKNRGGGMNIAEKIYARAFQKTFRLVIPFLPYRKPEILDGISELPKLFTKLEIRNALLVTDKGIRAMGLTRKLEELMAEAGIKLSVYDSTVANPTTDNVEEARRLFLSSGAEAIIGFGGGSSIDAAKAAGARIAYPKKPLAKMEGIIKVRRKIPLLVAIPTTAGTGSETTLASVIVDSKTRHKYPINSFPLIPGFAVLDPENTRTLPPALTATTGLDALTHAIEAYIGGSTTKETRAEAKEAVRLIFSSIIPAYHDGNDMRARRNMLHAAFLAGAAFTVSYVGYVHAVAHSLGGRYNIPHGLANAVILPHVLEKYGAKAEKKLAELAETVGIGGNDNHSKTAAFINAIKDMEHEMRIPQKLHGIRKEDIPIMAEYAAREANPLYPVPMLMDAKELEEFYYDIMEREKAGVATTA